MTQIQLGHSHRAYRVVRSGDVYVAIHQETSRYIDWGSALKQQFCRGDVLIIPADVTRARVYGPARMWSSHLYGPPENRTECPASGAYLSNCDYAVDGKRVDGFNFLLSGKCRCFDGDVYLLVDRQRWRKIVNAAPRKHRRECKYSGERESVVPFTDDECCCGDGRITVASLLNNPARLSRIVAAHREQEELANKVFGTETPNERAGAMSVDSKQRELDRQAEALRAQLARIEEEKQKFAAIPAEPVDEDGSGLVWFQKRFEISGWDDYQTAQTVSVFETGYNEPDPTDYSVNGVRLGKTYTYSAVRVPQTGRWVTTGPRSSDNGYLWPDLWLWIQETASMAGPTQVLRATAYEEI